MQFTTRPEITGAFGVATSTHWIASAVGFGVLEKGGNAFDAAVAMGFVLQVVEPHLNGPGGEFPAIFHDATRGETRVLCAQGPAPAGATIAHYRAEGLSLIPGSGLLATVIPGAFDGWMLMLRDYGTISLRDAMAPAVFYARMGHPILSAASVAIARLETVFRDAWPSSATVWTPSGAAPTPGSVFKNPALADTWERMLCEAEAVSGREAQIDAARRVFAQGFVAEAIDRFCRETAVLDTTGAHRKGVLTGDDMAGWSASYEPPTTLDYGGLTIAKTGPWGQGPALLQALSILKHTEIAAMDPNAPDVVHTIIETIKLAYADREAYYGDPRHSDAPIAKLLTDAHGAERAALIGRTASQDQRPSCLAGFETLADAAIARAARTPTAPVSADAGEPTMAHLSGAGARRGPLEGDTTHLDVIDRWGNMVSATPSGGWLQSNPIIPGLGFALNSRAQMFWLDEGLPASLAPGRRPRTTLTPSLALRGDAPYLALGSPGGDQQDQWQLIFLLRHLHHGMNLQEAIDAPLFHSMHFTSSFYPRATAPGRMLIEAAVGKETIQALARRGHEVIVAEDWTIGRLTAASKGEDGLLRAAATPRLVQAYAVGR